MTTTNSTVNTTQKNTAKLETDQQALAKRFYLACWRWHFYAGIYVAPFLIMLAVTGLAMMYIAVFDGRDGEQISVNPAGDLQPLSTQSARVLERFPDSQLLEYIAPKTVTGARVFRIKQQTVDHMVAINPYTNAIIDSWVRRDGWYDLMADIHGELLIGDSGDRLIEIAASFGIVLIITGLYLWWPRNQQRLRQRVLPSLSTKGRLWWKSLHQTIGLYCSGLLLVFLLSGLAWAGIWGGKFIQPWNSFPAEKWDDVPLSERNHGSMNHGAIKDVPWGLELTPMPLSGSESGITGLGADTAITLDSIAHFAQTLGYQGRFRIHYPQTASGVWTLSQDAMSNDSNTPTGDRTVHIDQYTGRILADITFQDYTVIAKAMAVGIAFHEGDMGLWNLVLNTVFCLAVIFIAISGMVMWWQRRPSKAIKLAAPPLPKNLPLWKGAIVIMLLVSLIFPMLGITLLVVLVIDLLLIQNSKRLSRMLS